MQPHIAAIIKSFHGIDTPEDRKAMHAWQQSLPKGSRARYDAEEAAYESAELGDVFRARAGRRP